MSDQVQCILAVASTLRQLVQALRRDPTVEGDGPIVVGERNGKITLTECSDFMDLVTSLLNDVEGDYNELQTLLLNTDPTLIPTIVSLLTLAPAISANASASNFQGDEVTPFVKLVLSSIQCLLQIVTLGCVDVFQSPHRARSEQDPDAITVSDPSSVPPEGRRLSEMIGAMLKRTELAHSLVILLDQSCCPSPIARFGVAKLLFTSSLRVPSVKAALAAQQPLLEGLFSSAAVEGNSKTRSYIIGTLREVAGSHPLEFTESDENVRVFARIVATDPLADARAMSAEAIDIVYRNQPQRWAKCGVKKDLSTAIVSRLESEDNAEALLATLRLLETLLIADAALTLGKPMRMATTTAETSFSEHFVNARGERSLITSIQGTNDTDGLASRCFRLLVEFAPYYCEVGYSAARHFPTISIVLKAVVALSADVSEMTNVSDMRFELSLAVALLLSQDPRSRQLLSEELRRNATWMGRLRAALLSNLNHSTLSDFSGIRIIDVMGDNLSDTKNVGWEEDGQRPSRDSLETFMAEQFSRFAGYQSRGGHSANGMLRNHFIRDVPTADPNGESLITRLTFIILTNTIHNTFNVNRKLAMPDGSEVPNLLTTRGLSTSAVDSGSIAGKGQLLADLGQGGRQLGQGSDYTAQPQRPTDLDSLLKQGNDDMIINELSHISAHQSRAHSYLPAAGPMPGQTRTSLIREWKNHPKKLEAVKQMARQAQVEAEEAANSGEADQSRAYKPQPANFAQRAKQATRGNAPAAPTGDVLRNPSSQYRDNFVDSYADPFREPTRESFKKAHKPTINQLVATNQPEQQLLVKKTFTKFDAALKLCERLGLHYSPLTDAIQHAALAASKNNTTVFETSGDGFAKRKSANVAPVVKRQPKTWNVDDLREGDLFYFAVPLNTLSAFAVDQVRVQAVRHHNQLKKAYLVVPHHMKGRRWFIFDMSTFVMPQVIAALDDILELMEVHGEQNCRFPLLMFKEGDMVKRDRIAQQLLDGGHSAEANDAVPEATLNSGNLLESLDQLRFYFSKMSEVNPVAATAAATIPTPSGLRHAAGNIGAAQSSAMAGNTSQYLVDLERKINALKSRQFEPRVDAKFSKSFGGVGVSAVIGGGGIAEDDEDELDETNAVPISDRAARNAPVVTSLSAARARAMLSFDGGDEVEALEPLGTTARASSHSMPRS